MKPIAEMINLNRYASVKELLTKHKNLTNNIKSEDHITSNQYLNDMTSLLVLAIKKGYLDIVKLLIDEGARINFPDKHGNYPLHYASLYGYDSTLKLLCERGSVVDKQNFSGDTPLHLAAKKGLTEIIKLLIKHGADIEKKTYYQRHHSILQHNSAAQTV